MNPFIVFLLFSSSFLANSYETWYKKQTGKKIWKGKTILEKRVEGLFWSMNRLCDIDDVCFKTGIDREILKSAVLQAKSVCQNAFLYEPWNCVYTKSTFKKTSKETGFLYAVLASSLADTITRECAKGRKDFPCGNCNRNWPTRDCIHDMSKAKEHAKNFFSLKPLKGHLHHKVLVHDSLLGLKIFVASNIKKCKCHGISGSCSTKTCWTSPSPFINVIKNLKVKYNLAERVEFSNRQDTPLDSYRLTYIDPSDDFCSHVNGRKCSDCENCRMLCCGRNYTTKISTEKNHCNCRWKENYRLHCDICLSFLTEYECQ